MYFLSVLFLACLLDALFGDPRWFPHPVRLIGRFALAVELFTRKLPLDLYNSGRLAMLIILCGTGGVTCTLLVLLSRAPQPVFFVGATFILYTTIAARDLIHHACQVVDALTLDTLDITLARKRVGMIVGRDTDQLDTAGIVRACVESVAENMSDGIIAPLFWVVIGAVLGQIIGQIIADSPVILGVTAAMLYKAINTMDSMFGYKNERYLQFGSCPARLDDAVNFLPARLSGGL